MRLWTCSPRTGSRASTGILFIGFFAQASWNGVSDGLAVRKRREASSPTRHSQRSQGLCTPSFATFVILRVMALFTPLRVTEREEALGLDTVSHGEEAYATGEGAILVTPEAGLEGPRPVANPV